MGDNGAGKSTLVMTIAGNFLPSAGEIRIHGVPKRFHKPVEVRADGIEVVYQDLALCDNLSATANVFLGREIKKAVGPFKTSISPRCTHASPSSLGSSSPETRARSCKQMSGGQRQAVAIARTRLSDAKIVLMDEPTAAISVRQVAEVLELIRRLKDRGVAVVLISHRMPDVFAVSDRIAVIRRGIESSRQGGRM